MSDNIDFYPIIAGLDKIEPITLAKDSNKPFQFNPNEFSIRACPGIKDITQLGYIIPLWQDLLIKYDHENGVQVMQSGNMYDFDGKNFFDVQFHRESSLGEYSFGPEYVNFSLKLRCPWYVKTKPNTSILLLPVQYNQELPFTVASGILQSDKYPMLVAQIILKKFQGEIILKKGTPLIQVVAIKDQPKLVIHKDDTGIKKNINVIKNWLYSRMHSAIQYKNLEKILK